MTQYYGYRSASRGGIQILIALAILVFGVISYVGHSSYNPVTGEKQHVAMSPQQEVQLGLQSAPEMAAQMGGEVDPNDPQAREVRRIGQKVVDSSDAEKNGYSFQFHLLNDQQTVNAFALPGGQVFITRGLLERMSNEGQLAGVLGHESGHVAARHSSEQLAKSNLWRSVVTAVGVGASDSNNPNRGMSAAMVAQMVAQMKNLQYSREDETQADELGLRFMSQAGFDPRAMIEVMQILQKVTPATGRQPEFMVTHPYPEHRIENIEQWLKKNFPNGVPPHLTSGERLRRGIPVGR
jgi:beta-barrel assembly-enhancing protease